MNVHEYWLEWLVMVALTIGTDTTAAKVMTEVQTSGWTFAAVAGSVSVLAMASILMILMIDVIRKHPNF